MDDGRMENSGSDGGATKMWSPRVVHVEFVGCETVLEVCLLEQCSSWLCFIFICFWFARPTPDTVPRLFHTASQGQDFQSACDHPYGMGEGSLQSHPWSRKATRHPTERFAFHNTIGPWLLSSAASVLDALMEEKIHAGFFHSRHVHLILAPLVNRLEH